MIPLAPSRPAVRGSLATIFAIPALLLVATLAGLVIGLTGGGVRDVIAWIMLAIPSIALAIAWVRRG